jgi:hypothetical protein
VSGGRLPTCLLQARRHLESGPCVTRHTRTLTQPHACPPARLRSTFTQEQRAAFFQLAYDQLLDAKANNGPLMGIMFWTVAIGAVCAIRPSASSIDFNEIK